MRRALVITGLVLGLLLLARVGASISLVRSAENRSWALTGPATVTLWIAGVFLVTQAQPGEHATGSEILSWYTSHTSTILLDGWIFMPGSSGS
jgi:hypothetical protein